MRDPWTLSLAVIAAVAPLPCQTNLVVDASGQTGRFRTIGAAVAAFRYGDVIQVKKGVYNERLTLTNQPVHIMGIAPNASDVVLRAPNRPGAAVVIANHPSNRISRFSRLRIDGFGNTPGVDVRSSAGDLIFEEIESANNWVFNGHDGTVAMSACLLRTNYTVLSATRVRTLFCHACLLLTSGSAFPPAVFPATMVSSSDVHFSRCSMSGLRWGSFGSAVTGGGDALAASGSTVRVSGLPSDTITGGAGRIAAIRPRWGGSGIRLGGSTLWISGVTVTGGRGQDPFTLKIQNAPAIVADGSSTVNRVAFMPVLTERFTLPPKGGHFSRGRLTVVDVVAAPSAQSVTWLALELAPFPTPWGSFVVDLGKPFLARPLTHDARGRASFAMDLRNLPISFVGSPYAMQTMSLDRSNSLSLSGPRIGVIGL